MRAFVIKCNLILCVSLVKIINICSLYSVSSIICSSAFKKMLVLSHSFPSFLIYLFINLLTYLLINLNTGKPEISEGLECGLGRDTISLHQYGVCGTDRQTDRQTRTPMKTVLSVACAR